MLQLPDKAKQYLLVALKVLILGITSYYIYTKFTVDNTLDWARFIKDVGKTNGLWLHIILCFLLTGFNWLFEIFKWKSLINTLFPNSFSTALKQSLVALTVSLATPNRIGDYGAKAYFFKSKYRKKVLLLNLFSNGTQMFATIFFGVIGLLIVSLTYKIEISILNGLLLLTVCIGFIVVGYLLRRQQLVIRGLTLQNVWHYLKKIDSRTKVKTFLYSFLRYAIFSLLFIELLSVFDSQISYDQCIPLVFTMYLLVSLIPSVFIFDVVVRGGVAVWLFSFLGIDELTVLSAVFIMWMLNFVIPAGIGGILLFTYKPERS